MEPVSIFLLLIVLALILVFVTRPLFEKQQDHPTKDVHDLSSLLAERERLLIALQELDFDQALGKIPVEDYPFQRTELLQKGADVLRKLDAVVSTSNGTVDLESTKNNGSEQSIGLLTENDLDDLLIKRRSAQKAKTAGFCPKCGKPALQMDVYCPSCGSVLR
jgi:hypothetical protein